MDYKAFFLWLLFPVRLLMLAVSVPAQTRAVIAPTRSEPDPAAQAQARAVYAKLPMSFEANQGQSHGAVRFMARGSGYSLFLTASEAVLVLKQGPATEVPNLKTRTAPFETVVRMRPVGGYPKPVVVGLDELPGQSSYFIGQDPQKWRTAVPHYARVEYRNVYPGVNLVYHGDQQQLEYDLVLAPGADAQRIKLAFDGAERLRIDERGDLVLYTKGGELRHHKPVVYQEVNGVKRIVDGRYVRRGKRHVGFAIAPYDRSKPLVIDPALAYSTYVGGRGGDKSNSIAVDASGNVYITGSTNSANFPMSAPLQPDLRGSYDAFVTKINATGSSLIYSTYLGGSGNEEGWGVAVDASGNAYVTGLTNSRDFPTVNPLQPAFAGANDVFVAKLNAAGSALVYSTYLGGSGDDQSRGIAVDAAGNAYVVGFTVSTTNFPVANAVQSAYGGGFSDAFVTKLNASGSALVYSTYLGGRAAEEGNGIAVDTAGNAYVTGQTTSTNFPTARPLQPALRGLLDAFVTKLDAAGSSLVYSTYLGGSSYEYGNGIAVDTAGNAYVTGETDSTDFPTVNPLQPTYGGASDAYVTKLNAAGSALVYSTYLGGGLFDTSRAIAVNAAGNAYVTGTTTSLDFPTTFGAWQPTSGASYDVFLSKLNAAGSALTYSTYLGGSAEDEGNGIAVHANGNVYVTGHTHSTDFPTTSGVFQSAFGGGYDAFVAKIVPADCLDAPMAQTPSGATASHRPTFTWSAVAGAQSYTVVLAFVNNPSDVIVVGTSTTTSLTPTFDIPDGDYQWRVNPSSASCESGIYSDAQFFTIPGTCPLAAPTLLSPPDAMATSNPVQFSWTSVPGASLYNMYVVYITGELARQQTVTTTTLTATFGVGSYAWVVAGWNSTCGEGPLSSARTFGIPP